MAMGGGARSSRSITCCAVLLAAALLFSTPATTGWFGYFSFLLCTCPSLPHSARAVSVDADTAVLGTTRPTHYHILHDEIGFTPDDLQELVHSLSYVYQRSTTAISVVAPICYAHLAAAQVSQFVKFDEMSETSSSQGGHTSVGSSPVPELPFLHNRVRSSMFFC
ncbi:hypothetical protein ABZP36_011308 [Zizania latifolia]